MGHIYVIFVNLHLVQAFIFFHFSPVLPRLYILRTNHNAHRAFCRTTLVSWVASRVLLHLFGSPQKLTFTRGSTFRSSRNKKAVGKARLSTSSKLFFLPFFFFSPFVDLGVFSKRLTARSCIGLHSGRPKIETTAGKKRQIKRQNIAMFLTLQKQTRPQVNSQLGDRQEVGNSICRYWPLRRENHQAPCHTSNQQYLPL